MNKKFKIYWKDKNMMTGYIESKNKSEAREKIVSSYSREDFEIEEID